MPNDALPADEGAPADADPYLDLVQKGEAGSEAGSEAEAHLAQRQPLFGPYDDRYDTRCDWALLWVAHGGPLDRHRVTMHNRADRKWLAHRGDTGMTVDVAGIDVPAFPRRAVVEGYYEASSHDARTLRWCPTLDDGMLLVGRGGQSPHGYQ